MSALAARPGICSTDSCSRNAFTWAGVPGETRKVPIVELKLRGPLPEALEVPVAPYVTSKAEKPATCGVADDVPLKFWTPLPLKAVTGCSAAL